MTLVKVTGNEVPEAYKLTIYNRDYDNGYFMILALAIYTTDDLIIITIIINSNNKLFQPFRIIPPILAILNGFKRTQSYSSSYEGVAFMKSKHRVLPTPVVR